MVPSSEMLVEAVPEALKNMLLVLASRDVLKAGWADPADSSIDLWVQLACLKLCVLQCWLFVLSFCPRNFPKQALPIVQTFLTSCMLPQVGGNLAGQQEDQQRADASAAGHGAGAAAGAAAGAGAGADAAAAAAAGGGIVDMSCRSLPVSGQLKFVPGAEISLGSTMWSEMPWIGTQARSVGCLARLVS